MIKIYLQGQLGNQMFQYAAGHSFALDNKTTFELLSTAGSKFLVSKYFNLPSHKKSELQYTTEFYKAKVKKHLKIKNKKTIVLSNENPVDYNLAKIQDGKYYSGFFQSKLYFTSNIKAIQKEFELKDHHRNDFQAKYGEIFSNYNTVAIHIRKGDYTTFGNSKQGGADLSLPIKYYIKGINQLHTNNTKIIIVSDDIDYCKKHLPISDQYIFSNSSEIIDFQILLNSDKLIISNSTFSWWAALLNQKSHKQIIAPRYWLGHLIKEEYPQGISNELNYQWIEVA